MRIRLLAVEDYDAVKQLWLETPGMGLNDRDDSRQALQHICGEIHLPALQRRMRAAWLALF